MYGFKTEPVLITAFVGAVLFALVEFGVPLTGSQQTAVQAVIAAALALFARSQVTSQATLEAAAGPNAAAKVAEAAASSTQTLTLTRNVMVALLFGLGLTACANNPNPTARPDAYVAQAAKYGTQAVDYVTVAQNIVNTYTVAQGGRTTETDRISTAIRDRVIPQAERLRTAFNVYAVASNSVAQASAIKDLQTQLDIYEQLVEDVLETNVPDGLSAQLVRTVHDIRELVNNIRDAFLSGGVATKPVAQQQYPQNRILVGEAR